MSNLVPGSLRDKLARAKASLGNLREKATQTTHMVAEVGTSTVVSGGLGYLDASRGEIKNAASDYGFKQHYMGPVPTSAVVGAVGFVGALALPHNSMESKMALGAAQGGINACAYVYGARQALKQKAKGK